MTKTWLRKQRDFSPCRVPKAGAEYAVAFSSTPPTRGKPLRSTAGGGVLEEKTSKQENNSKKMYCNTGIVINGDLTSTQVHCVLE